MNLAIASNLIAKGFESTNKPETWVDLGCGTGLFTQALASVLPSGSAVYAVDKEVSSLTKVPTECNGNKIVTIHQDFVHDRPTWPICDGILMANSLHFVDDKLEFLRRVKTALKPKGCIVVVEYEMENPNAWVPYPVSFLTLTEVMTYAGFNTVTKLEEEPSMFSPAKIYSALVK